MKKVKQEDEEEEEEEEEEEVKDTGFTNLDENLLFEVLKHADTRSLSRAACVNKIWHKTSQDESLWELICTRCFTNFGCATQQLRSVVPISDAVRRIFSPHFDKVICFQNSSLYPFSMFHASHHISPVPATEDQIEAEAIAVRVVAKDFCPLKIMLDRVIFGTDPVIIRAKLRTALPHAPEKQLVV